MTVAISGASGLVGSALAASLKHDGHTVMPMLRRATTDPHAIAWDPEAGTIEAEKFKNVDAVVHLAGYGIAEGRWTDKHKALVRDSRLKGTDLVARTLAGLGGDGPGTLISASAIGYYGDRGDEELTEGSDPGTGFMPEVCVAWEAAACPAVEAGLRVAHPRIGIVLAKSGGALAKMLTPFKWGLGGRLGHGRQFMSWISLHDLVRVIRFAIDHDSVVGPFNAVGTEPATNRIFTKSLGRVLGRPTLFPAPAFALRLMLGREMADALLLSSARVLPARLGDSGFRFDHVDLETALRHELGRA